MTGRMPFAPLENGKYDAETYNVPHNVIAFAITAMAKEDGTVTGTGEIPFPVEETEKEVVVTITAEDSVSTDTNTFTVIRQEAEDSA